MFIVVARAKPVPLNAPVLEMYAGNGDDVDGKLDGDEEGGDEDEDDLSQLATRRLVRFRIQSHTSWS